MPCLISQTLKMISLVKSFLYSDKQGTPEDTAAETLCFNSSPKKITIKITHVKQHHKNSDRFCLFGLFVM